MRAERQNERLERHQDGVDDDSGQEQGYDRGFAPYSSNRIDQQDAEYRTYKGQQRRQREE